MANSTVIIPLSGSIQGKGIKVAATSTPGTTIHATGTSATVVDRLYLWAVNDDTATRDLSLEWGGTTSPDNVIMSFSLPFKSGLILLADGLPLLGNGTVALTVGAFASSANVVCLYGYVLRVTP